VYNLFNKISAKIILKLYVCGIFDLYILNKEVLQEYTVKL
jgi:hypothetical protein